jgi:Arc/MetJ family transcription regulator
MMRTTLTIDDELMSFLMRSTQQKTATQAIKMAINEYIKNKRNRELLSLRGQVNLLDNWQALRQLDTAPIEPLQA